MPLCLHKKTVGFPRGFIVTKAICYSLEEDRRSPFVCVICPASWWMRYAVESSTLIVRFSPINYFATRKMNRSDLYCLCTDWGLSVWLWQPPLTFSSSTIVYYCDSDWTHSFTPPQINIIDYQSAISSQNTKYSVLLLLLSQVIDSWELISTVEKKKNLVKKHFDTIKKSKLIMLSPGGLLLPQGMKPNQ